ncbi:MAG: hypothetical protein ACKVVP_20520 [Chloroflexota bacterium]
MVAISLKLSDELVRASGDCARVRGLSRAEYIRQAIELMNRETLREVKNRRLTAVSHRVRAESQRVNAEFAAIEHEPGTE